MKSINFICGNCKNNKECNRNYISKVEESIDIIEDNVKIRDDYPISVSISCEEYTNSSEDYKPGIEVDRVIVLSQRKQFKSTDKDIERLEKMLKDSGYKVVILPYGLEKVSERYVPIDEGSNQ